jgi:GT2 family glycosyltransferase
MTSVMIGIPISPRLPTVLADRCLTLATALPGANRRFLCDLQVNAAAVPSGPRLARLAAARNPLVEMALNKGHDYLLMVDSDVVQYPADIIERLHETNPDGISAPTVLIEGTDSFYDFMGFLHGDPPREVGVLPPYWPAALEPVVPMHAVGTLYLINMRVFRETGVRYADPICGATDHIPVCLAAHRLGVPVTADSRVIVHHADLPRYGLAWN